MDDVDGSSGRKHATVVVDIPELPDIINPALVSAVARLVALRFRRLYADPQ